MCSKTEPRPRLAAWCGAVGAAGLWGLAWPASVGLAVGVGFEDVTDTHLPPTQEVCHAFSVGDVDADGDVDVVLANSGLSHVWINQGDGVFIEAAVGQFPRIEAEAVAAALVDVNRDRALDLVLADARGTVRLLTNDGPGVFVDNTSTRLPANISSCTDVEFADIDGDGDSDLVLAGGEAPNRLLVNDGNGVFVEEGEMRLGRDNEPAVRVTALDANADGAPDLLLLDAAGGVRLLLNDRRGCFYQDSAAGIPPGGGKCLDVAAEDLDNDGTMDLALALGNGGVAVLLNRGRGAFRERAAEARGGSAGPALQIRLGDLNCDGFVDAVIASAGAPFCRLNDGTSFGVESVLPVRVKAQTTAIALLDVDNDLDLDVLLATADGRCRLLLNQAAGPRILLTVEPRTVAVGGQARVTARASDADGIQSVILRVNGKVVPLVDGSAVVRPDAPGCVSIVAMAVSRHNQFAMRRAVLPVVAPLPRAGGKAARPAEVRVRPLSPPERTVRPAAATRPGVEPATPREASLPVADSTRSSEPAASPKVPEVAAPLLPAEVPVLGLGPEARLNEGVTLRREITVRPAPPPSWTGSVDYGDGTGEQPLESGAGGAYRLVHAYSKGGVYQLGVTFRPPEGPALAGALTVRVSNVAPEVDAGSVARLDVGVVFDRVVFFLDPGQGPWRAEVDYGDGSGVETVECSAEKTIALRHVYSAPGRFTVTVAVRDGCGGIGIGTFAAEVSDTGATPARSRAGSGPAVGPE